MGVGGQRHAPAALPPEMRLCNHCIGGWVGSRADLDGCGKSGTHKNSIPGPSNLQGIAIPTELCRPTYNFLKGTIWNHLLSETFLILRTIQRGVIINESWISWHIFTKFSNIKYDHPSTGAEFFRADRRSDTTQLSVAFRNFANASKTNSSFHHIALSTSRFPKSWCNGLKIYHSKLAKISFKNNTLLWSTGI